MKKYFRLPTLLLVAVFAASSCTDQFDEDAGRISFPAKAKLGAWQSLGNDTANYDFQSYLVENKDGDTINATLYIDPKTKKIDFSRVGGDITYNAVTGVTDVLYSGSPWDYDFKLLYDASTTLQRISLAERIDGRFGVQTVIYVISPQYSEPAPAVLFNNIAEFKDFATPYGKWEDTNENGSTFTALFRLDGTVDIVTPWGEDSGTFSFNETTNKGQIIAEYEPAPIDFAYNEKKQISILYDGETFALCPKPIN